MTSGLQAIRAAYMERPIKTRRASDCDLAEKISKLQSDNDGLKQRLALIESSMSSNIIVPDITPPHSYKKRKIIKRNNDQSLVIRTIYTRYQENNDNDGWLFSLGPREGNNLIIRNYIFEHCRLHQAKESEEDPVKYQFPPLEKKETDKRITCFFHSQKRKYRDTYNKTEEQKIDKREKSSRRSRLHRKWERRIDTYEKKKDHFVQTFGPEEECELLLEKSYMSEEDVGDRNEQGLTINYTALVPNWRSDRLAEFYKQLDSLREVTVLGSAPSERISKIVESSISRDVLDTLPTWGVEPTCKSE
ncbi:hypothetical protein HPULCUR_008176 [Helicostylum pulchrum]|uniref:Uncharacterized protein n=1 Tax=Helicostylum pulchrum TaxID=562976 RepID=A0ABP9Y8T9_9FUNG